MVPTTLKRSTKTGIFWLATELRSGAASYYEQDGLGSVTSLSSSTGSLVNTYVYRPFGNLANSTGSTVNPFEYTGRDYDPETGLRYYRARYYDSNNGRFLSEDPLGTGGGVNFYLYAENRATSATDPLGLQALPKPAPITPTGPAPINLEGPAILYLGLSMGQLVWQGVQTIQAINSANAADANLAQAEHNLNQAIQQLNSGPYGSAVLNYQSNMAKRKCQNNGCQPCIPPVGTIAYRLDATGPAHRGVPTPHWHLYVMQQNPPPSCLCQWVDIKDNQGGFGPGAPPQGTVPIGPAAGGGPR